MESTVRPSPERTLMGMPAPKELVDKIRGHQVYKKLEILIAAAKNEPSTKEGQEITNEAIRWLGKNASIMEDAEKADALHIIKVVAKFGAMYVDPLEAGFAMKTLGAKEAERTEFSVMMARSRHISIKINLAEKVPLYYTLLAATFGDEKSVRMVLFWADMALEAAPGSPVALIYGEVPTKAARIALAYPEIVAKINAEQEKIRAETPSYEQLIAELKAKKAAEAKKDAGA